MEGYGFEVLSKNTMETFSNDVFFQFLKNIFLYIWGLGFFFKTVLLDARKERLMQGHARRGEGTRVHEARLHGVDLLGRPALFVADEPTQPIFDDEPPEDIVHPSLRRATARYARAYRTPCARANVFSATLTGLWLTTTGLGRVAALVGLVTPCCRRAGLTPALCVDWAEVGSFAIPALS